MTDSLRQSKRTRTGYLLYADEIRAQVKESLTTDLAPGDTLKPLDVVKAIATQWHEEDQRTRDAWNAFAKTPPTHGGGKRKSRKSRKIKSKKRKSKKGKSKKGKSKKGKSRK
jgi:hypothetical protein